MGPIVKSFSELILFLRDEALDTCPTESDVVDLHHRTAVVSLGEYAAIKISPRRNGDFHVRIIKHGRQEDLFPADYLVEKGGSVKVQRGGPCPPGHRRLSSESRMSGGGKYDFEVHVDARYTELLNGIDWNDESLSGRDSETTLRPEDDDGIKGLPALRTGIFIKSDNGEVREYTNDKVELKILEFDVVDQNGDGVFEPGDLIRVENITIQNIASATSPAIPLSIVPTRWIQPVDAGLRLSPIPAGGTVKIEGHLRGLIVQDMKRDYSKSICVIEMVRLVATLPDIGREPASTSVEKQITVRYPLHMELLECPSWLSPTSTSRISWKITNISRKPMNRPSATILSIRDSQNKLIFTESPKSSRAIDHFTLLQPNESKIITKSIKALDTEGCSCPLIRLDILLSEPQSDPIFFSQRQSLHPPLRPILSVDRSITIAKPLQYTEADILLVPHCATSEETVLEWKSFIADLGLQMDIYNLGLYHTFEPQGRDVLGMYRSKTIILLGNEIHHHPTTPTTPNPLTSQDPVSCLSLLDTGEITKLVAYGTSILVCDVEMARGRDMRRWLADVVHRTYLLPNAHQFMESDSIIKSLRQKNDDTKYIVPVKGAAWEKQAEKLGRALDKYFPGRRFTVCQQDREKISVREGLGYEALVSVMFRTNTSDEIWMMQYTLVSLLPFRTRVSLLWPLLVSSKNLLIMEYLTVSIANSLIIEQRTGRSKYRNEFLDFGTERFDASSIVFVTTILSTLSRRGLRRKSTDEIQLFLDRHYSLDLVEMANSRLRWARRLSGRDIRTRIAAACKMDLAEYDSRILNANEIETEIHVRNVIRSPRTNDGRRNFEERYKDCIGELLEFIPSSLTRYGSLEGDVDSRNSSATLLPEPELEMGLKDFLKTDPFKNW